MEEEGLKESFWRGTLVGLQLNSFLEHWEIQLNLIPRIIPSEAPHIAYTFWETHR